MEQQVGLKAVPYAVGQGVLVEHLDWAHRQEEDDQAPAQLLGL
jgi:hypothetical protein